MLNNLNRRIYSDGDVVFREGDEGSCAYLIDEGEVEIIMLLNGREQLVNRLGKNELFGEVALIDQQPRTATAKASGRIVLIPIPREMMNELMDRTDPIVRHLLLVILERYRNKRGPSQYSSPSVPARAEVVKKHEDIRGEATQKLVMASDIKRAMHREEFEMFYQPICALASGQVAGYEALIRWRHPESGLIPPLDFLWLAEQTGLIRDLGLWTLERACRDWPVLRTTTNYPRPFVSVNMSPSQLTGDSFVADVRHIIARHRMPVTELKLELTETVIIDRPEVALNLLQQLTAMQITLALDDFGTGHSSLDTLNRYPIGTMKIDRSFIDVMTTSPQSGEIVKSSIKLAHSLGMNVVAEGIESDEVRVRLLELQCEFGQGWLFGKPAELSRIVA